MNLIRIYQCLCDETRLRLLNILREGPLCVCHLQTVLEKSQVDISRHLAYLKARGAVESRRHHNWKIYSLPAKPPRELVAQLKCLQDCTRENAVFRQDLRRLRGIRQDCRWVAKTKKKTACC
jgi:DNA-binding transcriptional ArsR family regulator